MGIEYPAPEQACYGQITADKYAALLAKLKSDPDASNLYATPVMGSVTYQKIDFSWAYDRDFAELTVTITANHNWKAKIAGNMAIFERLNDQLLNPKLT